ncbi:MAG: hypothetical protein HYX28_09275 [Candidatus Koribacter versatilis]|uniref:Uncharacterized protein n=1 Tax=Candidatus Korobacter versatilis TaxID=658062 RepID=A0A932EPM0_9BACT|nr:hypothetical protein [Candidatus Koribacter versatilis]
MRARFLLTLLLVASCFAADKPAAKPREKPAALLPQEFAEWRKTAPQATTDPGVADPANAAVMKEYGFTDFESATYAKPGRTLKLRAARFEDKSGAYGAFTFYKQPQMITQQIGDQASSGNETVLFYKGNVLVQAVFDRITGMSAAELRELADALPQPAGEAQVPPTLPTYFPKPSYVKNSVKYVLGPAGLNAVGAPIAGELVDFSKSPEIALAHYTTSAGEATLMLLYYPTPQIAAVRLREIDAAMNANPDAHSERDTYASKRTGPIVALVTGAAPMGEAKSLLASVTYDADVTWNEKTKLTPRDNPINLIWAAIKLTGYLLAAMFALGILYAAGRIALRKYYPQYVRDGGEMISLDLRARTSATEGAGPPLSSPLPPGEAK